PAKREIDFCRALLLSLAGTGGVDFADELPLERIGAPASSCRRLEGFGLPGRRAMDCQSLLSAVAFSGALWVGAAGAQLCDFGKYPDLRGQWVRYGPSGPDLKGPLIRLGPSGIFRTRFDPSKPPGLGQEAPLTPEYQAIF